MKYVILIYSNPESRDIWASMPPEQRATGLTVYEQLDKDLTESGELIVSEALNDPSTAKRVAVREGRTITSDGPFAEVKEVLAGFYLVECETPERAVEIAGRIPEAELGLVEVRSVLGLDDLLHN